MTAFRVQSCDCDGDICSIIQTATGPILCSFAMVLILFSRSRSPNNLPRLEYSVDQRSCGEQEPSAHFIIFGVLFCLSGMLLTTIGVWVVSCPESTDGQSSNLTIKVNENEKCKLLFLQIMGPAVTFVGICFLLMAHAKRKVALSAAEESTSTNDQQLYVSGPRQIATVISAMLPAPSVANSSLMILVFCNFPAILLFTTSFLTDSSGFVLPLPPPYFPNPLVNDVDHPASSEDPPSYFSVISCRAEEQQGDLQDTLGADEVPDSIPPPSYDEIFPVENEDTSGL
ncbi:transmembrane protein 171 isoform X1 [Hemitrygon akajei]|uniref:transmembrane protein 171 isoform X1 n=1 Tax=Hemitrygon akajei TaxID=2704970 RepID=UPI003BF9F849